MEPGSGAGIMRGNRRETLKWAEMGYEELGKTQGREERQREGERIGERQREGRGI